MMFNHLSVAKKISLLVLLIVGLLTSVAGGLLYYNNRVASEVEHEVVEFDRRILQVVRWRAASELAVTHIMAANMSSEPAVSEALLKKQADYSEQSGQLQKELEAVLTHPQVRQQLEKIATLRTAVLANIATADTELPQLMHAMQELVELQTQRRNQVVQAGHQTERNALWIGIAVLAGVVALGLLLAQALVRQITQPLGHAVALANTIAAGDLTVNAYDSRQDELGYLLRAMDAMVHKLRDVVGQVRSGVQSVSSAAGEISSGNQDLSARTEQTAANLEETAASMEQLTATVSQSSDTARQANQLANTAVQAATRGGEVVQQVVTSMDLINTSSRKISDIIGVIDGIAFQTNILALNAAVEAARAGEQGRGFAVVAGEVRTLAGRSAEAAKEIKQLITASVSNVDTGAEQVAQAGQSMQEIVTSVRHVTDLIGEITASSTEQRDGISQVTQAVANLDQMTQQNAALVEQSSAAADAMYDQAQRLSQVVAIFKVGQGDATSASPSPAARAAPRRSGSSRDSTGSTSASQAAHPAHAAPSVAKPQGAAKPVPRPAPKLAATRSPAMATASADDEWESF
ncbi:MAG: HAMP domain-containing protein [Comamonas sp.]|nr:HAMP domain-containing protein [Comamonas sp.]